MKENILKCCEGQYSRIMVTEEFITKNNFTLNRTREEIIEKLKSGTDFMGNKFEVLYHYLDWEDVKDRFTEEYIKKVDSGEKKIPEKITDIYETVQDMLDYLNFGYMKALDERGLSASRTIEKLRIWLWLLGRDDLAILVDDDELYNPYGMPALLALTEKLGLPVNDECVEFAKHKC